MKTIILLLLAGLTIGLVGTTVAQVNLSKVGQSTMNFQLVDISARGSALGDAVYASSVGSEAIFFNPAGMVEMSRSVDFNVMLTQWIADINYKALAVAWNLENYGAVGVSALIVDYGTIHATRLSSDASQGAVGYEDMGEMQNVGAYSFGLSYAKWINKQFTIGGTARLTGQNLGQSFLSGGVKDNNAHKGIFDVGVKYYTGFRSFRFGMAFRNFSSQLQRESYNEQMPVTFTMATAMDLLDVVSPDHDVHQNSLTAGVDYLHSNNFSERVNMGVEYITQGVFVLRAGYQTNRDLASWSFGSGVIVKFDSYDMQFNYSYSAEEYFTGTQRFSLGIAF